MTLKELHNEMVRKLVKPGDQIIKQTSPELAHAIHMTLGLVGECIEVESHISNPPEVFETDFGTDLMLELGDVMFYTVGALHYVDLNLETLLQEEMADPDHESLLFNLEAEADELGDGCMAEDLAPGHMVRAAGNVSEMFKKHWVYGKPLDIKKLRKLFYEIVAAVDLVALHYQNSDLVEVLRLNMEKLGARYKGFEYSDEAAIRKDDAQTQPEQGS